MRKELKKRQKGLTMISWMIVVGIGLFFTMLGIRLVPIYIDHYAIRNVLLTIQAEPNARKMNPRTIRQLIKRRLTINSVYGFDQKNIKISKKKSGTVIDLNYEVRTNMAGNIDALVYFSESVAL